MADKVLETVKMLIKVGVVMARTGVSGTEFDEIDVGDLEQPNQLFLGFCTYYAERERHFFRITIEPCEDPGVEIVPDDEEEE